MDTIDSQNIKIKEIFTYDVFISHSSKDKPVVRNLAQRLKADGLRIWFDEWEIKPGDMIGLKIEQGLEQSRTLVLVMSANAFASEWVALERHTVLFRDPTNANRRFIPLRIDDSEIKDTLKQFSYIDWQQRSNEQYAKLLEACRQPVLETKPAIYQNGELPQSKILIEKTALYCSRCGVVAGEKSTCVGGYSIHNFQSYKDKIYCSRCGVVAGEKSTCVGGYSIHNFQSYKDKIYCSRCGIVAGKKSTCVGGYSIHNFQE